MVTVYELLTGALDWRGFWRAARSSTVTTASVVLILISAHLINPFIALIHLPSEVSRLLFSADLGMYGTLLVILAVYLVLGCFLEGLAMLVVRRQSFRRWSCSWASIRSGSECWPF